MPPPSPPFPTSGALKTDNKSARWPEFARSDSDSTLVPWSFKNLIATYTINMLKIRCPRVMLVFIYLFIFRWCVLTGNSLDYYKSYVKNSPKFGSIVLTSLCSVVSPEEREPGTKIQHIYLSPYIYLTILFYVADFLTLKLTLVIFHLLERFNNWLFYSKMRLVPSNYE